MPTSVVPPQLRLTCGGAGQNGLVDALEFLATFALASGMELAEKINCAPAPRLPSLSLHCVLGRVTDATMWCAAVTFECYDFDESGELTIDEMTLSFKSTLTGLCKISGVPPPDEAELEVLAQEVRWGAACARAH